MAWILLATLGQFLNAVVAVVDKYIVTDERVMPRPFVYAFYSCLLTGGWLIVYAVGLVPGLGSIGVPQLGNIERPSLEVVAMSFLAAYTFFMALVSLYDALRRAEAVNVLPTVGAISALASFGLTYLFLDTPLSSNYIFGIALLALGTFLVAQNLPKINIVLQIIHSGLFFALHYITMKGLFIETSFDDGFFWSRIALLLFTLSLLLVPAYLEKIWAQTKSTTRRTGALVLFIKILAGIAAFLLLKATDMGSVAVVQALDGLKFLFILVITVFLAPLLPDSAAVHETRPRAVLRQVAYVLLILIGYIVLFAA